MIKIAAAAVFGLVGAWGGMWAADRTPPTDTIKVEIVPEYVQAGASAEVVYTYQRFRPCQRKSVQSIIDSTGREYAIGVSESPPYINRIMDRPDTFSQPITVPISARAGPAQYHVEIQDVCNPLHNLWPISKVIDVPFNIAP